MLYGLDRTVTSNLVSASRTHSHRLVLPTQAAATGDAAGAGKRAAEAVAGPGPDAASGSHNHNGAYARGRRPDGSTATVVAGDDRGGGVVSTAGAVVGATEEGVDWGRLLDGSRVLDLLYRLEVICERGGGWRAWQREGAGSGERASWDCLGL